MISGLGTSKKRHRVTFVADKPFFCFAGIWQSAKPDWPMAFAGLTVEASPDIAPLEDRDLAVVRPEDWHDWLTGTRPPEELLRPHPIGSFVVEGRMAKPAVVDLFNV